MKCINNGLLSASRFLRGMRPGNKCRPFAAVLFLCLSTLLTGCGSSFDMRFTDNAQNSNFNMLINASGSAEVAESFASDLCIVDPETEYGALETLGDSASAALFDLNGNRTIYAQNVYTKVYPASLTKIMTALVALQNASPDMILTASDNVYLADADAQVAGLAPGDTMTLDQALHILLIYSANDVAMMIAENIGGDVGTFIRMMNDEAKRLGATQTNFINSNGLSDANHFTSAYDMYLVFNEALQFSVFQEIISMPSYTTVYHDRDGNIKELTVNSTNMYLQNVEYPPTGITVIGGKTGTTTAAGHCLVQLVKDTSGRPYIAIVMKSLNVDLLYDNMNALLRLIPIN